MLRPVNRSRLTAIAVVIAGVLPPSVRAQTSGAGSATSAPASADVPTRTLALSEFLATVAKSNPDLAAQRSILMGVGAQREVAKLYPNPVLGLAYSADVTGNHMPSTFSPGLQQTVLLGGKVSARGDVTEHAYQQAAWQYEDFGRTLRSAAASAYVDALVAELDAARRRESADAVDRLANANQARFQAGEIGEADLLQSRVERLRFRADFLGAESSRRQSLLLLSLFMGTRGNDTLYAPVPFQYGAPRTFDLTALIDSAMQRRPDVLAARQATDAARAGAELTRANRVSDLALGFGVIANTQSTNEIAPSPAWQAAALSLSFPLPLSNLWNKGDLQVAQYAVEQAEHAQASVQVRAENDVRQSFARYSLAVERMNAYSGELLADADRVLAARTYSYQRGAASLTDVLIAQQAANDVYIAYYDALGEYLKSLVGVQVASGSAEIAF